MILSFVILILLIVITYLTFNKREKSAQDEKSSFEASIESKSDNTDDELFTLEIPSNESQPDFTDVKILSYTDLSAMNADEPIEFEFDDSGYIKEIVGNCAKFKVQNHNDALKVVYSLQEILSICDINDLRFFEEDHNSYNDIYRFRQYFNGISVNSGVVTVMVDANTKDAYIVHSNYDPDLRDSEFSSNISKSKAKEIIKEKFDIKTITNIELMIYDDDKKGNVPAWYIEVNSSDASYVFLDANTGEILYYHPAYIN